MSIIKELEHMHVPPPWGLRDPDLYRAIADWDAKEILNVTSRWEAYKLLDAGKLGNSMAAQVFTNWRNLLGENKHSGKEQLD